MQNRAFKLMKLWCDTLLSYQLKTHTPYTDNAILCPACHVVHGRIADLCFPLAVIYEKTGDTSYLEAADKLIDWSEYNLKSVKGFWYNDAGNRWYGTSAFSLLSIGDAIYHLGDKLPEKYRGKWLSIVIRIADALMEEDKNESFRPVSNYYCGIATALAFAWRLTGEKRYLEKSKWWLGVALERIDCDGLLFGEGYPMVADDGTHTVDMGYNLEESVPILLRYADITGEHRELFRDMLRAHLEFLLPDGGIDNSFGTRHNKWTYWGSRTSDGLLEGLALVLDEPMFLDACERVLSLYEKCTHDGLLAMPMAHEAEEPTCIHHTFTHAKALAALVCAEDVPNPQRTLLPCEQDYGVKEFQGGKLLLVSRGNMRATFSAIGAMLLPEYASNGGGSLNLLYHRDYGVICAATSAEYVPSEPLNQQYLRHADETPCMTAQFVVDGEMGCKDKSVTLSACGTEVTATAKKWQAKYAIGENELDITLCSPCGVYNLPIVCKKDSRVTLSEDSLTLSVDEKLIIEADTPLEVVCDKRVFNQVGGLLYLPISLAVKGCAKLSVRIIHRS